MFSDKTLILAKRGQIQQLEKSGLIRRPILVVGPYQTVAVEKCVEFNQNGLTKTVKCKFLSFQFFAFIVFELYLHITNHSK